MVSSPRSILILSRVPRVALAWAGQSPPGSVSTPTPEVPKHETIQKMKNKMQMICLFEELFSWELLAAGHQKEKIAPARDPQGGCSGAPAGPSPIAAPSWGCPRWPT